MAERISPRRPLPHTGLPGRINPKDTQRIAQHARCHGPRSGVDVIPPNPRAQFMSSATFRSNVPYQQVPGLAEMRLPVWE
jgi:hypothetical protein